MADEFDANVDLNNTTAVGRTLSYGDSAIAPNRSKLASLDPMMAKLDASWVQAAFMLGDIEFKEPADILNRYWTTAEMKFTNTRLGGSVGINPKPQYCQYSDLPVAGRLDLEFNSIENTTGDYGMGRLYSEMVDDAAQRITMVFGVPQYNTLLQFFAAAYESNQMTLARTGRATSAFYKAFQVAGYTTLLYAFPLVSVVMLTGKLLNFFISRPKSKFFTLKPTPHLYWSAVNQLAQAMAVNRGLLPKIFSPEDQQRIGQPFKIDEDYMKMLNLFIPDIFRDTHLGSLQFDIFAIATQAQRQALTVLRSDYETSDHMNSTDFVSYLKKQWGDGRHATPIQNKDGSKKLAATTAYYTSSTVLLSKFMERASEVLSFTIPSAGGENGEDLVEIDGRGIAYNDGETPKNPGSRDQRVEASGIRQFTENLDAQLQDGALFVNFIVDDTGAQNESWSNSVGASELAQSINGAVRNNAENRFSLADGNLVGGLIGTAVGAAAKAVKDSAAGFLNGVTGGLSQAVEGLAGAGFIDVPKHWQESSYNATTANYKMTLISPYGNVISQFMAIDVPMAMLMAGALPRSTGKASYTGPFLCSVFDRGRCQIRLGVIDKLAFTRGSSHLGFGDQGHAMRVDVNFSIADLTSMVHMPIASGLLGDFDTTVDDDNSLQDYLAVLAGMSVESQFYTVPRAKIKLAKSIMSYGKITSPAYLASVAGNTPVGEFLKMFTRQSAAVDFTGANT